MSYRKPRMCSYSESYGSFVAGCPPKTQFHVQRCRYCEVSY